MLKRSIPICILIAVLVPAAAISDDLTKMIQKDLIALGYDPGNIQGEMSTETIVAITKFQAENDMEITGEASPQLAGVIKAKLKARNNPGAGAVAAAPVAGAQKVGPKPRDEAALQEARQACLQEKVAAAQASQKKKRGFGSLMKAVTNTATRFGGNSTMAREVQETSRDIYDADATADDWNRAAKDLGLTESDIEACQNPPTTGAM